ncbi:MAG TPA: SDR family NAD(P)-dependent oxidoreductase [Gammaproteobacteria bacterium]|nr:SDR family NAD(P)-dependent oxidoreductase [Gammaproteobacteria bacterium]
MKSLTDKIAFVTGASAGIGYALAEALGRAGMRVMLAGINEQNLDGALAKLRSAGIEAERVQCDVGSRPSVQNAALATIAKFGKVHVVCNNAGVGMGGEVGSIAESDWEWVIRVNLMGVVHGTEIFAPLLAQHGEGGHIVNTSSIAGLLAGPGAEPYAATKFAVVAMSEGWRVQLAPRGVGVSVLCPAFVRTSIGRGQRNRPGGPQPGTEERSALLNKLVEAGMDPKMLAARVLEAIRDDELYIFTHPELKAAVEGRFNAILEAFDRAAKSPALKDHKPQDLSALMGPPPPRRPS